MTAPFASKEERDFAQKLVDDYLERVRERDGSQIAVDGDELAGHLAHFATYGTFLRNAKSDAAIRSGRVRALRDLFVSLSPERRARFLRARLPKGSVIPKKPTVDDFTACMVKTESVSAQTIRDDLYRP